MRSLHQIRHMLLTSALVLPIVACAPNPPLLVTSAPSSVETTATYKSLRSLPAPKKPVPVAVYSYPDLTGQFKPSDTVSTNSRAVTQGAVWMLVKALKDAAGGQWFKVIQRANLENLLRERQIIRETRGRIEKTSGRRQPTLPSLLFAGVILEGGIIGYDSNTVTGGLGARYLGIGGDVQYRQDTVTVYLNAISSQTGEVLKSVMTRKTVASYGVRGSVFKFVAFQKLLEGETGYTINEPGQIAIAQAIEHAVRALIIEGALDGLWQFENKIAGKEETQAYLADKDDLLLIGDATSDAAVALLTDEQLQELAKRQKKHRQEPETQSAHVDAREAHPKKNITIAETVPLAKATASADSPEKDREPIRRIEMPDSVQLAAQRRTAEAFSFKTVKATSFTLELEPSPHPSAESPALLQAATADISSEPTANRPTGRIVPALKAVAPVPVTPIRAVPLTFELERLPHPRPLSPASQQTVVTDISSEPIVAEPTDRNALTLYPVDPAQVAPIRVTPTRPGRLPHPQPANSMQIQTANVEPSDLVQDFGATIRKVEIPETAEVSTPNTVEESRSDFEPVTPTPQQPKGRTREQMAKAETGENVTTSGSTSQVMPVSESVPAGSISGVP